MLLQVKQYNKQAYNRWQQAVEKARENNSLLPNIAFYLYFNNKGNKRKNGWVVTYQNGSRYFKNKKESKNYLNNGY